jgi:hypothetical protein
VRRDRAVAVEELGEDLVRVAVLVERGPRGRAGEGAAMTHRITQAEFAKAQGWNRSTVTRLKQAGRLVMDGKLVDPVASLVRIRDTGGMRFDVAERHAEQRAQQDGQNATVVPSAGTGEGEGQGAAPIGQPAPDLAVSGGERRADAQARKESALADMAEMDVRQKRGELIPRDDVDAALRSFGASVRAKLDVLPDQLAPLVAPVADMDEIHALLAEHCRSILSAVADDMSRAAMAAGQGAS